MKKEIIQEIINRNSSGTIIFPEVLEILSKEKVESYHVDFLRNESRYYGVDGESLVMITAHSQVPIPERFSIVQFKGILQQVQEEKINYEEFCDGSKASGCAYYIVYLRGKQVHYMGRNGEQYIEHFPK
ncbi:MAG: DUF1398 family protein [Parachlamydiaceae bacterium]|nr:DUF1398 family protein [Parachlamydiaceae bacterium]